MTDKDKIKLLEDEVEYYRKLVKKLSSNTQPENEYIEMMAAAYIKHTNIPPDEVVLNVGVPENGKSMQYWMTRKTGNEKAICSHPSL